MPRTPGGPVPTGPVRASDPSEHTDLPAHPDPSSGQVGFQGGGLPRPRARPRGRASKRCAGPGGPSAGPAVPAGSVLNRQGPAAPLLRAGWPAGRPHRGVRSHQSTVVAVVARTLLAPASVLAVQLARRAVPACL